MDRNSAIATDQSLKCHHFHFLLFTSSEPKMANWNSRRKPPQFGAYSKKKTVRMPHIRLECGVVVCMGFIASMRTHTKYNYRKIDIYDYVRRSFISWMSECVCVCAPVRQNPAIS